MVKGRERKTEIKTIEVIEAKNVAIANAKLYMNREDGFVGTGLRKDEFLFDCSTLDDVIVFTKHGIMKVVKVGEKTYIGKDIIHACRISEK
jgi:topoisomerase-4 subunit A